MNNSNMPLPDDWLSAYLDGELSDAERAQVEAWLAVDHTAQARLDALRALGEDLRAVPRASLGAETSARLMASLAHEPKPSSPDAPARATLPKPQYRESNSRRRWAYVLATLATAALVALLVSPPQQRLEQVTQAPVDRENDRGQLLKRSSGPEAGAVDAQQDEPLPPASPSAMRAPTVAAPAADAPPMEPAQQTAKAAPAPVVTPADATQADALPAETPPNDASPLQASPRFESAEAGLAAGSVAPGAMAASAKSPAADGRRDAESSFANEAATRYVELQVPPEQLERLLRELAPEASAAGPERKDKEEARQQEPYVVDQEGGRWIVLTMEPAALKERLEAWPAVTMTTKDLAVAADAVRGGADEALRRVPPAAPIRTLLRVR